MPLLSEKSMLDTRNIDHIEYKSDGIMDSISHRFTRNGSKRFMADATAAKEIGLFPGISSLFHGIHASIKEAVSGKIKGIINQKINQLNAIKNFPVNIKWFDDDFLAKFCNNIPRFVDKNFNDVYKFFMSSQKIDAQKSPKDAMKVMENFCSPSLKPIMDNFIDKVPIYSLLATAATIGAGLMGAGPAVMAGLAGVGTGLTFSNYGSGTTKRKYYIYKAIHDDILKATGLDLTVSDGFEGTGSNQIHAIIRKYDTVNITINNQYEMKKIIQYLQNLVLVSEEISRNYSRLELRLNEYNAFLIDTAEKAIKDEKSKQAWEYLKVQIRMQCYYWVELFWIIDVLVRKIFDKLEVNNK